MPETTWNNDMGEMPANRPVLLRMTAAPFGWAVGGGATVTCGQFGNGSSKGIWTSDGFFPDKPAAGLPGSDIFVAWAEIPDFDAAPAAHDIPRVG